jgi:hypothetical protein
MISEEKKKVLKLFEEGRKSYKLMQFDKAKTFFENALKIDPEDGPSKIYCERCEEYIKEPPPEDWDGVYVMKTK